METDSVMSGKKHTYEETLLPIMRSFHILRRNPAEEASRIWTNCKSRDSSVGIALGYGLDERCSRVRFPVGAGNFSLHHRVQNGFGAYPASYPMGTRGSFPGGKAAGA
jgi:hypothetical protein